jgi:type I restriction enzyme M protein
MFEQTFKNIDDVLWKEAGCATELDYTEQTSWILFLKYLDDLEKANEQKAELQNKKYEYIIDAKLRWSVWAAPKKRDGSFDHDKALVGEDLIKYVNGKLFPFLKGFRTRAEGANTIEYKIGEIFSEIENKFRSGYSLRDALELMDGLSFRSQNQKHELSHIYEATRLRRSHAPNELRPIALAFSRATTENCRHFSISCSGNTSPRASANLIKRSSAPCSN